MLFGQKRRGAAGASAGAFWAKGSADDSKEFFKRSKADVADLMTEMCRYADIDKEFVLADFIREDTLYLKQVSRKKGLPEEKSKKADAYNKTAQEYNEAVDALVQHYPEAAHTDELEQIAQLMNRKECS